MEGRWSRDEAGRPEVILIRYLSGVCNQTGILSNHTMSLVILKQVTRTRVRWHLRGGIQAQKKFSRTSPSPQILRLKKRVKKVVIS